MASWIWYSKNQNVDFVLELKGYTGFVLPVPPKCKWKYFENIFIGVSVGNVFF